MCLIWGCWKRSVIYKFAFLYFKSNTQRWCLFMVYIIEIWGFSPFCFLKTEPKCSVKVVAYRKKLYPVTVKKYLLLCFFPVAASCTREALVEVTEHLLGFDSNGSAFLGFWCIFSPSVPLGRGMIEHLGGHMTSSQDQPTYCKLDCFTVFFLFDSALIRL